MHLPSTGFLQHPRPLDLNLRDMTPDGTPEIRRWIMREGQIRGRYGAAALRLSPVAGLKRYMTSSVAPRQHPLTADGDGDAAAGRGVRAHTHKRTPYLWDVNHFNSRC